MDEIQKTEKLNLYFITSIEKEYYNSRNLDYINQSKTIDNFNDIEIVKIKKKKHNNIEASSIDEKRSSEDLAFKSKNSGNYQINLTSNVKIHDRKQKKKKTKTNFVKKSSNKNLFESLKDSLENISEMIIKQKADILEAVTGCKINPESRKQSIEDDFMFNINI